MENYFVVDPALGTQEEFKWRNAIDANLNVVNYSNSSGSDHVQTEAVLCMPIVGVEGNHSAPISFYAASVVGTVKNPEMAQKGWRLIMAVQEDNAQPSDR